jgi:hypothetical protein
VAGLRGVDVAYADQQARVHQHGLDGGAPAARDAIEERCIERGQQRLDAEAAQQAMAFEVRRRGDVEDPEPARVDVAHQAVAEVHAPVLVRAPLWPDRAPADRLDREPAGHAEVHQRHRGACPRETEQQVLRAPFHCRAPPADQAAQRRLRHRPPQVGTAQFDSAQRASFQVRLGAAADRLDLRQFGHGRGITATR